MLTDTEIQDLIASASFKKGMTKRELDSFVHRAQVEGQDDGQIVESLLLADASTKLINHYFPQYNVAEHASTWSGPARRPSNSILIGLAMTVIIIVLILMRLGEV